ncbi:DNA-binding transcriptional LysR family regulator [Silvimonas terrae]|uniref:DNA-binding transcriptional LysR family regulator n=1 Tax=Silvimonas terrae TaxID=300266 RepID=A0A840RLI4_9NEIS|nr:LysR family transcriptional regulator [Silvimonas terrae]MBB5193464.1 DNA-binding transcriptional LysR family regulator [Silvimonas terrae]
MDTLMSMKVFCQVASLGSFVAAAERSGLSTAMVSKHIKHLESRLGVRLLNRTTRSLSLTGPGAMYFERCQHAISDLEDAESLLSQSAVNPRGTLKISAPAVFSVNYLAPVLADYYARYPQMRIDLDLSDRVIDLVEEGFDMAVRISASPHPSLVARRLAQINLLFVASPAYLAKHGVPRDASELVDHQCITYTYTNNGAAWVFDGPDGKFSVSINPRLRVNNGEMAVRAALQGLGITVQPTILIQEHIHAGRLVPILLDYPRPPVSVFAVYPSRTFISAKLRTFIDVLVEHFGDTAPWEDESLKAYIKSKTKPRQLVTESR